MIEFFSSLIVIFSFFLLFCLNPVKMGFLLIFFRLLNFFVIFFSSGGSWFPLIFTLLFIGGVMVLFMVISSLFSNEKTDNYSFILISFAFLLIRFLMFSFCQFVVFGLENKIFITVGFNFSFMVSLVLGYFFLFLFFISFEKASLRSFC